MPLFEPVASFSPFFVFFHPIKDRKFVKSKYSYKFFFIW